MNLVAVNPHRTKLFKAKCVFNLNITCLNDRYPQQFSLLKQGEFDNL